MASAAAAASVRALMVSCVSATIVRLARLAMGALASRLTAMTWRQSLIPCKCCTAPEMPNAIYTLASTVLPVAAERCASSSS